MAAVVVGCHRDYVRRCRRHYRPWSCWLWLVARLAAGYDTYLAGCFAVALSSRLSPGLVGLCHRHQMPGPTLQVGLPPVVSPRHVTLYAIGARLRSGNCFRLATGIDAVVSSSLPDHRRCHHRHRPVIVNTTAHGHCIAEHQHVNSPYVPRSAPTSTLTSSTARTNVTPPYCWHTMSYAHHRLARHQAAHGRAAFFSHRAWSAVSRTAHHGHHLPPAITNHRLLPSPSSSGHLGGYRHTGSSRNGGAVVSS